MSTENIFYFLIHEQVIQNSCADFFKMTIKSLIISQNCFTLYTTHTHLIQAFDSFRGTSKIAAYCNTKLYKRGLALSAVEILIRYLIYQLRRLFSIFLSSVGLAFVRRLTLVYCAVQLVHSTKLWVVLTDYTARLGYGFQCIC